MSADTLADTHRAFTRSPDLDALLTEVRRYALEVTGDEDAAQVATTKVWRYLPRFNPAKGTFVGWVRRIARRAARPYRREIEKHIEDSVDAHLDLVAPSSSRIDPRLLDLLPRLEAGDAAILRKAISHRTSLYRAAIDLGLSDRISAPAIKRIKKLANAPVI